MLVAPLELGTAEIGGGEVLALDGSAHRPVEDENQPGEGVKGDDFSRTDIPPVTYATNSDPS